MEVFLAFAIGVILGIIFTKLATRRDGRLVIDGSDYFIAITTSPEELTKRKQVHLKVVVTGRGEKK